MQMQPIAFFHSPLTSKFGVPRQSGLVDELKGTIVFEPPFRRMEAVRGLEDFDYLWLIWEFSLPQPLRGRGEMPPIPQPLRGRGETPPIPQLIQGREEASQGVSLTVRPPRLGGNRRMGVFATRSPFRPNPLALSCVRLDRVEEDERLGPVVHVLGADLMDGTPIFDIKPYIAYADSHPDARSGFVDKTEWKELEVVMDDDMAALFTPEELRALHGVLALDPRPRYHDDASRVYGMPFAGRDVRFRVDRGRLIVVGISGGKL